MADAVTEAQEFIHLLPEQRRGADGARPDGPRARAPGQARAGGRAVHAAHPRAAERSRCRYVSIGDVRLRQRRFDEAIASYESALRLRPGDPDILGQLGLALRAASRMSRGVAGLRRRGRGAAHRHPAAQSAGAARWRAEGRYLDAVRARCGGSWSWRRPTTTAATTCGSWSSWRPSRRAQPQGAPWTPGARPVVARVGRTRPRSGTDP